MLPSILGQQNARMRSYLLCLSDILNHLSHLREMSLWSPFGTPVEYPIYFLSFLFLFVHFFFFFSFFCPARNFPITEPNGN